MITEAIESYRCLMDTSDEATTASLLDWYIGQVRVILASFDSHPYFHPGLKNDCGALCATLGDAALAANSYDKAIELYSAAIEFDSGTDSIFANSSKAKLEKRLWEEALLDAQKVRCHLMFRCQFSFFECTGHRTQPFVLPWIPVEARSASWHT